MLGIVPSNLVCDILSQAIACGASDVVLKTGAPPRLRVNGEWLEAATPAVEPDDIASLAGVCAIPGESADADASFAWPEGGRFRVNFHQSLGRPGAVLRRIRPEIPALESLGLPVEVLVSWMKTRSGLVILSGPTGSGKSTTAAAILERINQTLPRHIVTIEDPLEYLFRDACAVFTQREVGIDTPSFAEGLRRSLRQAPDVIFLGEIRDSESAATALQASETGHLVLTTLHSASAPEALERLELFFREGERARMRQAVASQVRGILCQRLLPATSGGRVAACEFFTNAASSRVLIAGGRFPEIADFIDRNPSGASQALEEALAGLVKSGTVAAEEALLHCLRPQNLERRLRGIASHPSAARR
jgi:twitching motility protein PilT